VLLWHTPSVTTWMHCWERMMLVLFLNTDRLEWTRNSTTGGSIGWLVSQLNIDILSTTSRNHYSHNQRNTRDFAHSQFRS
jgi:hypothetical protein